MNIKVLTVFVSCVEPSHAYAKFYGLDSNRRVCRRDLVPHLGTGKFLDLEPVHPVWLRVRPCCHGLDDNGASHG